MPFAMIIGSDGRFEAVSNPAIRSGVAPPALPPPGSLKKPTTVITQSHQTPSRKSNHAAGPVDFSDVLPRVASQDDTFGSPSANAALAFFRRGRERGDTIMSPTALRRQSSDTRISVPPSVSCTHSVAGASMGGPHVSVSVDLTPTELREEVRLLRIRCGHLERRLLETETDRDNAEADLMLKKKTDVHADMETKKAVAAKLHALQSLASPLKSRLDALLARAKEYHPSEISAREGIASTGVLYHGITQSVQLGGSHLGVTRAGSGVPTHGPGSQYAQTHSFHNQANNLENGVPRLPLQQETRWSARDIETLAHACTQLGLVLEAQSTLAARVTALAALVTVPQQIVELLSAVERSQESVAALTFQVTQLQRENEQLLQHAGDASRSSYVTAGNGSSGEGEDQRVEAGEVQPTPTPTKSRAAMLAEAQCTLRALHGRSDAGLPGFGRAATAALGANPSEAINYGSSARDKTYESEDDYVDMVHDRVAWCAFTAELSCAIAPLERVHAHDKAERPDVAGRGALLWRDARAIAREHRGADWDAERHAVEGANVQSSTTWTAEVKAFRAAVGRITGHNPRAIPDRTIAMLYDMATGPMQKLLRPEPPC